MYHVKRAWCYEYTPSKLCAISYIMFTKLIIKIGINYFDKFFLGLDPMIWEQGKRANPNPKKYLPVPMVGFQELKARFK